MQCYFCNIYLGHNKIVDPNSIPFWSVSEVYILGFFVVELFGVEQIELGSTCLAHPTQVHSRTNRILLS